nr:MAG TPA: hypothetical protein [Caudoviricetes sp.]
MSEREHLIEIINNIKIRSRTLGDLFYKSVIEKIADQLLENGVIVPHAKIGESIYYVELEINADKTAFEPKIHRTTVTDITIAYNYTMYSTSCGKTFPHSLFGELVFSTKEEALKALKGYETNE